MRYSRPEIRDYGTLLELTGHIDVNFYGVVTNVVMAALSNPFGGVAGEHSSNVSGDPSGGGAGGLIERATGGRLPFTGFPPMLLAAFGAAVASVGVALRSALSRPRRLRAGTRARR